jgi:hypothetical protein
MPEIFTASINSKLLTEIKSLFTLIDPSIFYSEFKKELLLQNVLLVNYNLQGKLLKNFKLFSDKFSSNFSYANLNQPLALTLSRDISTVVTKSQYKPMRKGISNMIRLQATNAIAMPTEIRLHILASSKDVIHS